jgi:hypothetical protein
MWLTSGLMPTSNPTSGSSKRCSGAIHRPCRAAATGLPAWSIVDADSGGHGEPMAVRNAPSAEYISTWACTAVAA